MAFSLACDTGKTTLRIEGTDSSVTWNDVANAGAGSVAVDGGGTEDPSFFVTEHDANDLYQILKDIQFGDGTNALIFYSKRETVFFDAGKGFTIKANATVELGELDVSYGINGSRWSIDPTDGDIIATSEDGTAIFKMYGSTLHNRAQNDSIFFKTGTIILNSSMITVDSTQSDANRLINFRVNVTQINFNEVYFSGLYKITVNLTPDSFVGVHIHSTASFAVTDPVTVTSLELTEVDGISISTMGAYLILINPEQHVVKENLSHSHSSNYTIERYTCDIHVVDKNGNDLEGVTVLCEDKDDNQIFSVQTDGNGDIAQQTIDYKKWEGTAETETEYNPHKFTFSKNGYTLLVMENFTVDARINWDIEVKFPERIRARMANLGRRAILR